MSKGEGTRSGLLWEVERLLNEVDELPQILLMENVPQVHSDKNVADFAKWIDRLEKLGYKSKYQDLNAKDYGVPQNRERCFMVSWLGDYYYHFPAPIPLEKRLKDVLEESVDEKFYLSDETVKRLIIHKERNEANGNGFGWQPVDGGVLHTLLLPQQRSQTATTSLSVLMSRREIMAGTDVAACLMARDYKGFGNQLMNGVIEIE